MKKDLATVISKSKLSLEYLIQKLEAFVDQQRPYDTEGGTIMVADIDTQKEFVTKALKLHGIHLDSKPPTNSDNANNIPQVTINISTKQDLDDLKQASLDFNKLSNALDVTETKEQQSTT